MLVKLRSRPLYSINCLSFMHPAETLRGQQHNAQHLRWVSQMSGSKDSKRLLFIFFDFLVNLEKLSFSAGFESVP